MNELEVGMYIRSKDGLDGIGTLIKIDGLSLTVQHNGFNNIMTANHYKKASYNIIDLIEVGDYVNGEKVTNVENGYLAFGDYEYYISRDEDVKTVVTKEQFDKISYPLDKFKAEGIK